MKRSAKEYGPFVTSIKGWAKQPSVEKLENLLSNQEALAKQLAKGFESDVVLFPKGKSNKKNLSRNMTNKKTQMQKKMPTYKLRRPSNVLDVKRLGISRNIVR